MTRKQEIQKQNHPKKGSMITVEPIKELKDIKNLKKLLSDKPMDLTLFTIGINTNLRASDILGIKAHQVKELPLTGGKLRIKEKKTGKIRWVNLNGACMRAITKLMGAVEYDPDDFLFRSQRANKNGERVWSVPYVNAKVKGWCREINLKGNYGSHTLRKTWGYHQRITFKRDLPILTQAFNHASQKQTLDYLCIQEQEVEDVFQNEL